MKIGLLLAGKYQDWVLNTKYWTDAAIEYDIDAKYAKRNNVDANNENVNEDDYENNDDDEEVYEGDDESYVEEDDMP